MRVQKKAPHSRQCQLILCAALLFCLPIAAAAGVDVRLLMGQFFPGDQPQIFIPVRVQPDGPSVNTQVWQDALKVTITSVRGIDGAEWYDAESSFEKAVFSRVQVQANQAEGAPFLSGLRAVQLKKGIKADRIDRISGRVSLLLTGETLTAVLTPEASRYSVHGLGNIYLGSLESRTADLALSDGLKQRHIVSIEGLDNQGKPVEGTSRRIHDNDTQIWQRFAAPIVAVRIVIAPQAREVKQTFVLHAGKPAPLIFRTAHKTTLKGRIRIHKILDFGTFRSVQVTLSVDAHKRLPDLKGVRYGVECLSAHIMEDGASIPVEAGPLETSLSRRNTGNQLTGSLDLRLPEQYTKTGLALKGELGLRLPTKITTLKLTPADLGQAHTVQGLEITLTEVTSKVVRATMTAPTTEAIDQGFIGFYASAKGHSVRGGSSRAFSETHGKGVRSLLEWAMQGKPQELLFHIAEGSELARGPFEVTSGGEVDLRFE